MPNVIPLLLCLPLVSLSGHQAAGSPHRAPPPAPGVDEKCSVIRPEIQWSCIVGPTAFSRVLSDFQITGESTKKFDEVWERYWQSLRDGIVRQLAVVDQRREALEDTIEPALSRDPALDDPSTVEGTRLRRLRELRAAGKELFPSDPRFQELMSRAAGETTAKLIATEAIARMRLADELAESINPGTDEHLRARLKSRLTVEGLASDSAERGIRPPRDPGPNMWYDFLGLVRRECESGHSLESVGPECLTLSDVPTGAGSPLAREIRGVLISHDELVAARAGEWLRNRSLRGMLESRSPQLDSEEANRLYRLLDEQAGAICRCHWDAYEAIRKSLASQPVPSATRKWELAALGDMFPSLFRPDETDVAMEGALGKLAASDVSLPQLRKLQSEYASARHEIRVQLARVLMEGAAWGGISKATRDTAARLRKELDALSATALEEFRTRLGTDKADLLPGPARVPPT